MLENLNSIFCYLCSAFLVTANLVYLALGAVCITFGSAWHLLLAPAGYKSDELRRLIGYLSAAADGPPADDVAVAAQNALRAVGPIDTVLLVIGIALTVLAVVGCCGLCCRSRGCLAAYLAIVSLVFLVQLIFLMLLYGSPDSFRTLVQQMMQRNVERYIGIGSANGASLLLNALHIYAGCCGVNNGSDFQSAGAAQWDRSYTMKHFRQTYAYNLTYPVSCCQYDLAKLELRDPFCPVNNLHYSNHRVGCYEKVMRFVDDCFERHYVFQGLAAIVGIQALLIAGILVIFHDITDRSNKVHPAV